MCTVLVDLAMDSFCSEEDVVLSQALDMFESSASTQPYSEGYPAPVVELNHVHRHSSPSVTQPGPAILDSRSSPGIDARTLREMVCLPSPCVPLPPADTKLTVSIHC